jgi:hypothetical protein
VEFYNLDAIIAVGYRVNSRQATQFRIWATQVLREFLVKGFVLDDERLKQGKRFGKDYFDELLERIRAIRASERRFYLKITDIYEQCSIDYNRDAEITQAFFKTVQNKLHWAICVFRSKWASDSTGSGTRFRLKRDMIPLGSGPHFGLERNAVPHGTESRPAWNGTGDGGVESEQAALVIPGRCFPEVKGEYFARTEITHEKNTRNPTPPF